MAIDREIDEIKAIPLAYLAACRLEDALHDAEEIYIDTSSYAERTEDEKDIFDKSVDGVEPSYIYYSVGEADTATFHYSLLLITFPK